MQQIAQWLEQLGMSKYVQRFSDNRIDVSVLRDLSDQISRIWASPLGYRWNCELRLA